MSKTKHPIDLAADAAGNASALARGLGIHRSAISGWRRKGKIPADRVLDTERLTGIPREKLRPDLYERRRSPKKRMAA